jgi:hypothetical protein
MSQISLPATGSGLSSAGAGVQSTWSPTNLLCLFQVVQLCLRKAMDLLLGIYWQVVLGMVDNQEKEGTNFFKKTRPARGKPPLSILIRRPSHTGRENPQTPNVHKLSELFMPTLNNT